MIASMVNYCPYTGAGVSPTGIGKSGKTISQMFRYVGFNLPKSSSFVKITGISTTPFKFISMLPCKVGTSNKAMSLYSRYVGSLTPKITSYYKILGVTNVLLASTGAKPVQAGGSKTAIPYITKYTGTILPDPSSYKNGVRMSQLWDINTIPLINTIGSKCTGIDAPLVGVSSQKIASIFKYVGVLSPKSSSFSTLLRFPILAFGYARVITTTGLRIPKAGTTINSFSQQLKYTGLRLFKVGTIGTRVNIWQTNVVTQAQAVVQTLIQFWS